MGCGKSVATKFLIQHLTQLRPRPTVAYFFCDDKYILKKTKEGLVRALLYQVLSADKEFLNDKNFSYDRKLDQKIFLWVNLWNLFCETYHRHASTGRQVFVLIDAIDELGTDDRDTFLRSFRDLMSEASDRYKTTRRTFKVLMTSRPWTAVSDYLSTYATIDFGASAERVYGDISNTIQDRVRDFAAKERYPKSLVARITTTIIEKSEGMFLWADLAWNRFQKTDEEWSLRTAELKLQELNELPIGIAPLFDFLLRQLKPGALGWYIFAWLAHALRPMEATEFDIVIALRHHQGQSFTLERSFNIERSVKRLCGPFIRFDPSSNTINLLHTSAKEFLLATNPQTMSNAHKMIYTSCLTYLCFPDISWGPVNTVPTFADSHYAKCCSDHLFLAYSSAFWYQHYIRSRSPEDRIVTPTHATIPYDQEAADRGFVFAKIPDVDHNTVHHGGQRALHYATLWGWDSVIDALLSAKDIDPGLQDDNDCSPLHIACYWGHEKAAQALVDRGAWRVAAKTDKKGWHPLHLIAKQENEGLAYSIIQQFHTLPSTINLPSPEGSTFLHSVVRLGWEKIFELLLRNSMIDFRVHDAAGKTPMHYAAVMKNSHMVRTLLSKGASTQDLDNSEKTALHYALDEGMLETVNILIAHGANCNVGDYEGKTPVYYAVSRDWVHVVESLEKHGANLNASDDMGIRPLHLAAMFGNPAIVQWLLKQPNVEINKPSINGNSVLFWAARARQEHILWLLLLSPRVNQEVKDRLGRTILHVCISWASSNLINHILLATSLELDHKDEFGLTCLHIAAMHEDAAKTIWKLLDDFEWQGLDINCTDALGRTPLHYAAMANSAAARQLLLHHADQSIRDHDNMLALDLAIIWKNTKVMSILDLSKANIPKLLSHM